MKTFKLVVDYDTADLLFKEILIDDYRSLINQKRDLTLKAVEKPLETYEAEDLDNTNRYIKAMKVMMEYYVGFDWKNRV